MNLLNILLLLGLGQMTHADVWKNLGENQCLNLKNYKETCGFLQFCSDSGLERGCRNCTDIYKQWCSDKLIDEFQRKFPSCVILCERQKVIQLTEELNQIKVSQQTTESELMATGEALRNSTLNNKKKDQELEDLNAENDAIRKEMKVLINNLITVSILAALAVTLLVGVIIVCCLCLHKKSTTQQTAACQNEEPQPEEQQIPLVFTNKKKLVTQPDDSGNGSELVSSTSNSSSTLSSERVPTGGTAHHPRDTDNFMTSMC